MASWVASCLSVAVAMPLIGCATAPTETTPESAAASVPTRWHAPLPHGGQVAELRRWWDRFGDPLLLRLLDAGQRVSPTVAQAGARIADARAVRTSSGAALQPSLDATASASRGVQVLGEPTGTTTSLGVQAAWELDLFGANRAGANAAQARLEGREAAWHDARVAVAAEVATTYVGVRACDAQLKQTELDARSRAETSRLTTLAADAGFQAPAAADLARASAAQGNATLTQQRAQCDLLVKSMVALTAVDEAALRRDLANSTVRLTMPVGLAISAVPAQVLAQRPDIVAAARDVVAASADSEQARALRWPRITLAGSIGTTRVASEGISTDGKVWSIGPVAVTLPLFDAGVRRANAQAALARYEAASVAYAASLRAAVREVESALVTLQSALQRGDDVVRAADGFERSYQATEARYRAGVASLFELEDARRSLVSARSALIDLQREGVVAWITMYRAVGGGWSASEVATDTSALPHG
jgi:NodT family efflux transporter outer membrane factor (OMF) lipoprotein